MDPSSDKVGTFGRTINISVIFLNNSGNSDTMEIALEGQFGEMFIWTGDGQFPQTFTIPMPATGITIICRNVVESCDEELTVLGT